LQKSTTEEPIQKKGISAYRDYYYLVFIGLTALYGTCFFQLFASVPQFFNRVSGYSEAWIGWLMALNGFVVVVFEMPLIAWLEKFKKPFPAIIAGVLCIPVSFAILFFSKPFLTGALIYTVIITLSEILAMPFMMNLALSRAGNGRQGQYAALYSIAFGISILLAPSVGLGIADWLSFGWMFGFFSTVSLLVAGGFMILSNKTSIKSNE
jgi:predicted MFS family arabinose efflux permease